MKVARLRVGTQTVLCKVEGDAAVPLQIDNAEPWADPLRVWLETGQPDTDTTVLDFPSAEVLAPVRAPQKIVCVGLNYRDHAAETGKAIPVAPMLFGKAPSAIVGPNEPIVWHRADSDQVDYEAELAVVIGQTMRDVSVEDALSYVFGYTVANDVSARDAQAADVQFFRAKSFDTFCPLGPVIVTPDELGNVQSLAIRTRINGEVFQNGTTADMVFSVAECLSYISRFTTLVPGDLVLTGTPAGVGVGRTPQRFLVDEDTVEVEIDGIGTLSNPCHVG